MFVVATASTVTMLADSLCDNENEHPMRSFLRHRTAALQWLPATLAFMLSACAVHRAPEPPRLEPAEPMFEVDHVPVPQAGIALVIQKSQRTLTVYRDGVAESEFPVVMGRNGNGPKRFEGDMRTPEGLYRVTEKHPHSRWRYFIGISYPNEYDVAAYARGIADGGIPVIDGEFIGIGGSVGIHGSDHYVEQATGSDWTMGCIALRSEDIGIIYDLVEPNTPVLILP